MSCKNGKIYFNEHVSGTRRGITKDVVRVYSLARKIYLGELIKERKEICAELGKAVCKASDIITENRSEKVLERFHMLDRSRIKLPPDKWRWANSPYCGNTYAKEYLKYVTDGGRIMRSKSERMIGNKLEEAGIAYRYEAELNIVSTEKAAGSSIEI